MIDVDNDIPNVAGSMRFPNESDYLISRLSTADSISPIPSKFEKLDTRTNCYRQHCCSEKIPLFEHDMNVLELLRRRAPFRGKTLRTLTFRLIR